MRGGSTQRARYPGLQRSRRPQARPVSDRPEGLRRNGYAAGRSAGRGTARPSKGTGVYWRRRFLAVCAVVLGVLALVTAAFAQGSGTGDQSLPIDPNGAGPDVVLADVAGISLSSPVRPEELTGLGYHPEGESFLEMSPRGENLSGNVLLGLFRGDTAEKIRYNLMPPAERPGPRTGALDVGAEAGTPVYAPVTGTIVAIRPDPVLQEGANVVEIKPADNPDVRVSVSLVQQIDEEVGPHSPVEAGMTEIGSVADSAKVLRPQLASYASGSGNHVTVSVSRVN